MDLKKLLKEKNLTSRQLSDLCQIPYSTVNDIINGKRNLAKCTAETVWKLAKQLDLSSVPGLLPLYNLRRGFSNG